MTEQDVFKILLWNISEDDPEKLDRAAKAFQLAVQKELTDVQRKYFVARYRDGLNYAQIGQKYGVNKASVWHTVDKGTKIIQRCLEYALL